MLSHTRRAWRTVVLIGALTVLVTAGLAGAQDTASSTQTDAQGSVTIKAVYVTRGYLKATPGSPLRGKVDLDRSVVFVITLDTHAGDLGNYNTLRNISVRSAQGPRVTAMKWLPIANGSHHREGALLFPKSTGTGQALEAPGKTLELTVRNLGGVPQRTLRWTLPRE